MKSNKIGIVVGRFQIDTPHEGHLYLINHALENHHEVLLLLGTTTVSSIKNPLNYKVRKAMMKGIYGDAVTIAPLADVNDDDAKWVRNLEQTVANHFGDVEAVLYGGSKESCVPCYLENGGRFETQEVKSLYNDEFILAATQYRDQIAKEIIDDANWRKGIIFAQYNNVYPTAFRTADVIVTRYRDGELQILLGQKKNEIGGKYWRLAGGFADPKNAITGKQGDLTGRHAAVRECEEETSLVFDPKDFRIIDEVQVDDSRYKHTEHSIMTTIYHTHMKNDDTQVEVGKDDLPVVQWFSLEEAEEIIRPVHRQLLAIFMESDAYYMLVMKNKKVSDHILRTYGDN
jgi:ADP-ribose pyrophosphatase YjhB (NUDIX family)